MTKLKKYNFEVQVSDFSKLKLKRFREIMFVVYKMLEIGTIVESEFYQIKNLPEDETKKNTKKKS